MFLPQSSSIFSANSTIAICSREITTNKEKEKASQFYKQIIQYTSRFHQNFIVCLFSNTNISLTQRKHWLFNWMWNAECFFVQKNYLNWSDLNHQKSDTQKLEFFIVMNGEYRCDSIHLNETCSFPMKLVRWLLRTSWMETLLYLHYQDELIVQ